MAASLRYYRVGTKEIARVCETFCANQCLFTQHVFQSPQSVLWKTGYRQIALELQKAILIQVVSTVFDSLHRNETLRIVWNAL